MLFNIRPRKNFKVRETINTFLFLPIMYKGRFHWLYQAKLERAFNGYKMMIIDVQKA
ncbi:hypothetical protein [Tenacibaculum agarivorans]|uniref:hypothetical protein n=1 Tax=Tenacibaculum agarivorans TaxID=1908389 RepID=UPI000AD830FA|nr:hypothetical protein [Tenacibaculum agarivorans]